MAIHGNCHCGGYRFDVQVDESDAKKQAAGVSSVAGRKLGYIGLPVTEATLTVTRDDGKLSTYTASGLEYKFCSACGTTVSATEGGTVSVNVRSLRGINPFDFELAPAATAADVSWPSKGSCLCGAVTVELLAPLADMAIKEDNCSVCARNAWRGAYPPRAHVAIHGADKVEDYTFSRKFTGHPFCRTCGVHVYMNVYGPPAAMVARLPEEKQAMIRKKLDVAPVNVRVLDDIDLSKLQVERTDEGTEGYEGEVLGL